MQSLRGCIETAAHRHIWRSALESQTPGHKARIKKLTALRDRAKALRTDFNDAITPSFTIEDIEIPLDACDLPISSTRQNAPSPRW